MIRRTLLALALLAAPAVVVGQQPSPMQGQAPATDTSKAKPAKKSAKMQAGKKTGGKKVMKKAAAKKPAATPKDTTMKP